MGSAFRELEKRCHYHNVQRKDMTCVKFSEERSIENIDIIKQNNVNGPIWICEQAGGPAHVACLHIYIDPFTLFRLILQM